MRYLKELEEIEQQKNDDKVKEAIVELFNKGIPTQEQVEELAKTLDIDVEEIHQRVIVLFAELIQQEQEEKAEGQEENHEVVEDAKTMSTIPAPNVTATQLPQVQEAKKKDEDEELVVIEDLPNEEADEDSEDEEGSESEEGEESEDKEEEELFKAGDFVIVKHENEDKESIFYGKNLEVEESEGDFVKVKYIDIHGNPTSVWFKSDEIINVEDAEDEIEGIEKEPNEVEAEEEEEIEECSNLKTESVGIYKLLKQRLQYLK